MARNYNPLVQLSFRTTRERKEYLEQSAKHSNKTLSQYLDEIIADRIASFKDENNEKYERIINTLKFTMEDEKRRISDKVAELFVALNLSDPLDRDNYMEHLDYLIDIAKRKYIVKRK